MSIRPASSSTWPDLGLTGFAAEQALRHRHAIAPEMSDLLSVICVITPWDSLTGVDRLIAALSALAAERGFTKMAMSDHQVSCCGNHPRYRALTQEAYFAPTHMMPLTEAIGAVVAWPVVPYPPGIGSDTRRDRFPGQIAYLCTVVMEGMHVHGPARPNLTEHNASSMPRAWEGTLGVAPLRRCSRVHGSQEMEELR